MPGAKSAAQAVAASIFGVRATRTAAWAVARSRRRALALVYHRVHPLGWQPGDVVPTITPDQLEAHLAALAGVGQIVAAGALVDGHESGRWPAFAITFDDDYLAHLEYALPVLTRLEAPATFFLSGRAGQGLGPYWWQRLEGLIRRRGLAAAGRQVGVHATSAVEMAAAIEADPARIERLGVKDGDDVEILGDDGIRTLDRAGMTIGFHTVEHPVLPGLQADVVRHHVLEGRSRLEEVIAKPIDLFAYPHGKADGPTAHQVAMSGYRAAFAGTGRPIAGHTNRYLLPRWEPGSVDVPELLSGAAARLTRPAGGRR